MKSDNRGCCTNPNCHREKPEGRRGDLVISRLRSQFRACLEIASALKERLAMTGEESIAPRNDRKRHLSSRGFTLIELVIATTIILIVSLGFFGWASTIIQTNLSIERNNTAYTMAMDVAERLQRMSDNTLIQKRTGSTSKCVGYDGGGTLKGCNTSTSPPAICTSGTPQVLLSSDSTGLTILTNPWYGTTNKLYLYDKNNCQGKTWVDSTCGGAGNIDITTDTTLTGRIDHPNAAGSAYDSVNPIRSYRNTTYYAVWSVAYLPCNTSSTDRRKIFITVYWIDPEPSDSGIADVQTKIAAGTYTIKSVSIVVDKTIGTES